MPFIRSGQLRALAISSAKRNPLLPDVPTFKELGYPEIAAPACDVEGV
jgi:tripartite-type tricarboxylate transporter receptor subunit TctC